jgi:hypothetical protein
MHRREHVHDINEYRRNEVRSDQQRPGYAEWLALGAVAAGSIGAIVGMAKCRNGRTHEMAEPADPSLTAPHGDKLRGAVV